MRAKRAIQYAGRILDLNHGCKLTMNDFKLEIRFRATIFAMGQSLCFVSHEILRE